ncbi:branched-chain amino acid ABC transporter permease [Pasteurellaceae bacterium HPA106]|uniref:AzlC family ABC transporter permease n=1 Tax=Spirabiliibacterium pneumoniae TaxID=221400 RepID=UPI001AADBA7D|nr:AzlC family ABC transporter permease [Spirabiliibacterium pneumoniae]MBE2896396.1 branched-chain amino acid ABC transporter permease [Spirabiliibacterium pneumoniae]
MTSNQCVTPRAWSSLLRLTLPIAMGYYAAGIAYGILAISAGLPSWLVIILSVVVFSGAAQYAAIPLFVVGAGFFPLVISTFLISLRHLFYTLALHPDLPDKGVKRWYSALALTDENYALLFIQTREERKANIVRVNMLCQFYWVSASAIGVVLGQQFADVIPHLDFALPCLFAILAYEQFRQAQQWLPFLLATVGFFIAKVIAPNWSMLGGVLFCAAVILVRFYYQQRRQQGGA